MTLGEKIAFLRKKSEKSQEELASMLGVSRQSVSKWESDRSIPDLDKILLLSSIFSVSTDYLLKNENTALTETKADERSYDKYAKHITLKEASEFLRIKRYAAVRISFAVFLCIVSPVCLIFLGAASESERFTISENAAVGIGLCALLILITAAVSIFIFCSAKTKPFEYLCNEIFEVDKDAVILVRELQKNYSRKYVLYNIVGTALCILSAVPLFAAICFTEDDFIIALTVPILLLVVAFGVIFLVIAGITETSFQIILQEGDYKKEKKL